MRIDMHAYLAHALRFNAAELQAQSTVLPVLPPRVIDMHSHLGRPEDVASIDAALYANIISTYMHFTHEEHLQVRAMLWPRGVELLQVAFCFPFRGVDIRQGNRYVQDVARRDASFVPLLTGDPSDVAYTRQELETGRWSGLKMYAEQLYQPAQRITDFFPHPVLEVANALHLPIILHLPHTLLQDYPELLQLAARYPRLPVVVAHFGMARGAPEEIAAALRATAPYATIFYDTSWFKDPRVFQLGLALLGPERILYATDQPFNLMRAQFVQHPTLGERIVSDYPYHWADPQEQQFYRETTGLQGDTLLNFHFAGLLALWEALEAHYPQEDERRRASEMLFYQNASQLLSLSGGAHRPEARRTSYALPAQRISLGDRTWLQLHDERCAAAYYAAIERDRPSLREWLPWLDEERSVEDARAYIRAVQAQDADHQGFHCAIWAGGEIAGSIGYHNLDWANRKVELGYWLGSAYQGRGIVTRACRALITYAFEHLGLHKVEIRCATGNRRSRAVAERLGFVREGVIRDEEWLYDHFVDRVVYGMYASEWRGEASAAGRVR